MSNEQFLPYGRQDISEDEISAVTEVLRSDWLTTGPRVSEFEQLFAHSVGARHAVAVNSGTAALHAAYAALGLGAEDEVIVPCFTFAATANAAVYVGAKPIFADVNSDDLLIDPASVRKLIGSRTKAIVAVDFAGQPCDYQELRKICHEYNLPLLVDACHSLGGRWNDENVGTIGKLNAFSFHPVKTITTGEGGMISTDDEHLAARMRSFRNHGITTDLHEREKRGTHYYEMTELGFNYRLTDFQCALGMVQLRKLSGYIERRRAIAALYDSLLQDNQFFVPLRKHPTIEHGYHLYVVRVNESRLGKSRNQVFSELRANKIGAGVHYIPVHLHPYYQRQFQTKPGMCPIGEAASAQVLSLPIYPTMTNDDVQRVVGTLETIGRK